MFNYQKSKEFENRRVRLVQDGDIEPHEVLLDSFTQKREKEGIGDRRLEVPLLQKNLQAFFVFCFLVVSLLLAKTFYLQVFQGKNLLALAEENKFVISQTEAQRGVIYDRNFEQLVFNEPSFDLVLNPAGLPEAERESALKEVAFILKEEIEDLEEKIEQNQGGTVLVSENLSHENLILLESKINDLPGFEIQNNPIRNYKEGDVFSHVLGYISKIKSEELRAEPEVYTIADYVGRTGIENFYEESLRKNSGKIRIERDVQGNVLSKEIVQFPDSGNSLVLWLDSGLQRKITEELGKVLQAVGTKKAAVVALDPNTGGVLSLVSLPGFDNNLFQKGADQVKLSQLLSDSQKLRPLFNRAMSGGYLTGSVIKPFIASAALEEKIIDPEKDISCQGLITVPHRYDPEEEFNFHDWTTHGPTNLRKAIAESCNTYFYTIGGGYENQDGLGPTRIKKYLELFGWNSKTGIDLPGEAKGFIPDKEWKAEVKGEGWWDGDTYNLSIGQGFLQISPLEVAASFAVIANGGKLLRPQIVHKIIDSSVSSGGIDSAETIQEFFPEVVRDNFISASTLQIVREGMRQAVTGVNSPQASAVLLNFLPVSAAAKTGTAEIGGDRYHNWITVFAPYENPEIVLTVIIEDVKGVQAAALPVARDVLNWYFGR